MSLQKEDTKKKKAVEAVVRPSPHVRQPLISRSAVDVPSISRFLRDHGSSFSAAIAHRISSLAGGDDDDHSDLDSPAPMAEFHLSGVKVIVRVKPATSRPPPTPFPIK